MILSAIEVECPACGALPVFPCMTGTGKESSKCHAARGREAARLMAVLVEDAKERARQHAVNDLTQLTEQDLQDIAHAADLAVRQINVMSATASRFINLERRARAELRRRGTR